MSILTEKPIELVFLDRDGVINKEQGHITSLQKFEILEGVIDAILRLNSEGVKVILVTNQSGIARGVLSVAELEKIHEHLKNELRKVGAKLDDVFYSPWHPDKSVCSDMKWCDDHVDRKPNPGMITKGLKKYNIHPDCSCMIGDSMKDLEAANKAGVSFYGVISSKRKEIDGKCPLFNDLGEVVKFLT